MSDINRARKQKLAKVAIAKSNRVVVDIGGIAGDTVNKLNNLSSSLGVSYNSSNAVTNNDTVERLEANRLHGVVEGMTVTINPNPRYFNISIGVYYINGVRKEYSGGTIDTISIGGGSFASAIINSSGQVSLLANTFPTSTQLESKLEITAFSKSSSTVINKIGNSFFMSIDFMKKVYLRHKLFEGTIFAETAGMITESITPRQLDISGGELNSPNSDIKEIIADTNIEFQQIYRVGGIYQIETAMTTIINNTQYDNGDLIALDNNKYVVHTLARSSRTDALYLIIGDTEYNKDTDAIDAEYNLGIFASVIGSEIEPIANIVIEKDATSIDYIIDLRNGTKTTTSSLSSAFESRLAELEARVTALEGL